MSPVRALTLTPEAQNDVLPARAWYPLISPALADGFSRAVDEGCRLIVEQPFAWPLQGQQLRKLVLRRFPYNLLYPIHADTITVAAVAHHRRRPGLWRNRT